MSDGHTYDPSIAVSFAKVTKEYRTRFGGGVASLSGDVDAFIASLLRRTPVRASAAFKRVVDAVDLTVRKGQMIGITGPNGSGKSTLLKLIAKVTMPTAGQVYREGRVVPLIEIGAGFHDEFKGSENIYLNAVVLGMKKKEIDTVFDSIVSFAELQDAMDMPIKYYSSGMVVRLGFSIAVHAHPSILLIDEALAVGDAAFQIKCIEKLKFLREHEGVTTIVVSHDLPRLRELCDDIHFFEHGRIVRTEHIRSTSPHRSL